MAMLLRSQQIKCNWLHQGNMLSQQDCLNDEVIATTKCVLIWLYLHVYEVTADIFSVAIKYVWNGNAYIKLIQVHLVHLGDE